MSEAIAGFEEVPAEIESQQVMYDAIKMRTMLRLNDKRLRKLQLFDEFAGGCTNPINSRISFGKTIHQNAANHFAMHQEVYINAALADAALEKDLQINLEATGAIEAV